MLSDLIRSTFDKLPHLSGTSAISTRKDSTIRNSKIETTDYKVVREALDNFESIQERQSEMNKKLREILETKDSSQFQKSIPESLYIHYHLFSSELKEEGKKALVKELEGIGCRVLGASSQANKMLIAANWQSLLALRTIEKISLQKPQEYYGELSKSYEKSSEEYEIKERYRAYLIEQIQIKPSAPPEWEK